MRWRNFLAKIAGFKSKRRSPATDGLQRLYEDTMILVALIFKGKPFSRRATARKLSQPRWTAAYRLLKTVDVLDRRGELWREMAPDYDTAEWRVRDALNKRREREASRTYVPRPDSR